MSTDLTGCAAAIIAGGASRRMGQTKALIPYQGRPLIAGIADILRSLFPRVIVITDAPEIAAAAECEAYPDLYHGKGPLGGIHAALRATGIITFCVACDMPYLNPEFIIYQGRRRKEFDAIVPDVTGRLEPLHAFYAPCCSDLFAAELNAGAIRPLQMILPELHLLRIPETDTRRFDPTLRMFHNWNTPTDMADQI